MHYLRLGFAAAALTILGLPAHAASSDTILLHFTSQNGLSPSGTLLADGHGSFYGATLRGGTTGGVCLSGDINNPAGCGVIYKLSPPAAGKTAWTETVIYKFHGADGAGPVGSLIADGSGALYGVTSAGGGSKACAANPTNDIIGGCGVAFKLNPPALGKTAWTETILHVFSGTDGAGPDAGLTFDAHGNLVGTTGGGGNTAACPATAAGGVAGCGTVFELAKPSGGSSAWTLRQLHAFGGTDGRAPIGGVTLDAAGSVYGVTEAGGKFEPACPGDSNLHIAPGCGIVYKLVAPAAGGSIWREAILHQFTGVPDGAVPAGKLLLKAGKLYGVTAAGGTGSTIGATDTSGYGTAFELAPPSAGQTTWKASILYRFHGKPASSEPAGSLLPDANGNLYGVTFYGGTTNFGTVYKLAPPAPGKSAWSETTLHEFSVGSDGLYPIGGLIHGAGGKLYGITAFDNTFKVGAGTVFALTP
jgi:uncharacterized repeat protein (TIGR03803 family)